MSFQQVLPGTIDYSLSQRVRVVQALAKFRKDWQVIAQGKSLLEVESSVGLILADIADVLELSSQERHVLLGGKLINQVNSLLEERVEATLPS